MKPVIIMPKDWQNPAVPYSPAVKKGNMVFTPGQFSLDGKGERVGKGGTKAQTRQVLKNVRFCLSEAGPKMEDVVLPHVFLTDVSNFGAMNEVYREYFH